MNSSFRCRFCNRK